MEEPRSRDILPMHDEEEPEPIDAEEGPDPLYEKVTAGGLQELEARYRAAEERRRATAPPPDTRTPEQKAAQLQEFGCSVFLFGADGPFFRLGNDLQPYKLYLDQFLKEAGASGDALERMLLEQLVLAHHAIGRLHFRAGTCTNLDEVTSCLATVTRLQGEVRKTAVALETYRQSLASRKDRESKVGPRPRRKASTAAANSHGGNGETISHDTELASNTPPSRLNGYMNGTRHAIPTLS